MLLGAVAARAMPDEIFREVCNYLATAFEGLLPFDRVAIASVGEDDDRINLRGMWARTPDRYIPARYAGALSGSSLAAVRATRQPRILDDLVEYLHARPQSRATALLVREGYRSSLTCPLVCGECHSVGFLFFTSRTPYTYHREHVELFTVLADEVAGLLDDLTNGRHDSTAAALARLGDRLQALVPRARAILHEEQLVSRVIGLVHRGVRLGAVMDQVYDTFTALLPYDRIGFAQIDEESRTVAARWARSNGPTSLGLGYRLPLARTSLPVVLTTGTPRIIDDLPAYLQENPHSASTRLMVHEGMRSSLTFALGSRERPMAFLFFSSRAVGAYSDRHVARLARIAAPLSAVIEKALLIEELSEARARSDRLLGLLLPEPVAARLRAGETEIADHFEVTAVFADLVDFTRWSSLLPPIELMRTLRGLFTRFDAAAAELGVHKLRTMGDAWMAIAGLPTGREDHAEAAARLAQRIMEITAEFYEPGGHRIELRVGLHSGPVVAGVMGGSDLHYDAWGPALSVAARMESHGRPGHIRVSEATAARLPPGFVITEEAPQHVKSLGVVPTLWLGWGGPTRG